MSKTEDELWDETIERVRFLQSVGLDPAGSVAERLAGVRWLIGKLKEYETTVEADARSGDFFMAVPGEKVSVVVNPEGAVMVVHNGEKS